MKFQVLLGCAAVVISAGFVMAQEEEAPQVTRQEAMKAVGQSMGVAGKMAKGETEFNTASLLQAFTTMNEVSLVYGNMFPPGSETGFETEASPKIWEDPEGFNAALSQFQNAIAGALDANPTNAQELGTVLGPLGKSCGDCHETYRIKKS